MKLNDFMHKLNEGVAAHSENLLAYAITVAEAYHEAPKLQPDKVWHWTALVYSNDRLMSKVTFKVKVIPTPDDPYANETAMLKDIVFNKRLYVYSGHSDNHPVFTPDQNVAFRIIHDWFAHAGKNAKSLENFYKQQKLVSPQDAVAAAKEYEFKHSGFNLRGELNAYTSHSQLVPEDVLPALFTEIIGQVCSAVVLGGFPEQKVAVLDGFDYQFLGITYGARKERARELLAIIQDPSQEVIPTKVNGISINKKTFNWAGISPGTGATMAKQAGAMAGISHDPRLDKVKVRTKAKDAPVKFQAKHLPANESRVMEMAGAGPARIIQHIRQGTPFITISAMRSEYDAKTNKMADEHLRAALGTLPVSFIPVEGEFIETLDDGTQVPATESSYFVMPKHALGNTSLEKFKLLGLKLCKKFGQEAYGFGDGSKIYFIDQDEGSFYAGDAVTFDAAKIDKLPGFSKIKGRKFSFTKSRQHRDATKYNGAKNKGQTAPLPKKPHLP